MGGTVIGEVGGTRTPESRAAVQDTLAGDGLHLTPSLVVAPPTPVVQVVKVSLVPAGPGTLINDGHRHPYRSQY